MGRNDSEPVSSATSENAAYLFQIFGLIQWYHALEQKIQALEYSIPDGLWKMDTASDGFAEQLDQHFQALSDLISHPRSHDDILKSSSMYYSMHRAAKEQDMIRRKGAGDEKTETKK
jgi:hypothetical protein